MGNNSYVLKSADGGTTWNTINITVNDNLNTVTVTSSDTIIISSDRKIIRSYNGGKDWEAFTQNLGTITKSAFTNGKNGHAVCSEGRILKTIDGGITWNITNSVNTIPSKYLSLHFVNDKVGFACRELNTIVKTTDGGETWEVIPNTTDAIYSFYFLNENIGFMAGDHGVIFKTNDGGNSWNWAGFQKGRIYGTNITALYFTDEDTGFAVGMGGRILKTTNGGLDWKFYSPSHSAISGLFLTGENEIFAIGNSVLKSTDNGTSWNILTNNLDYDNFSYSKGFFLSATTGFILANRQLETKVLKTTDGGASWTQSTTGRNISSIYFVSHQTGFISGETIHSNYYIANTKDGGTTWNTIYTQYRFTEIWFTDELNGFGIAYGDLFQTSDGGKTWKKTHEIYGSLTQIYFLDNNIGFVSGEYGTVLKTKDGGKTWKELKTHYDHLQAITFLNENVGFVSGEYGTFQYTYNGGITWHKKERDHYRGIKILKIKNNFLYLAGEGGNIVKEPFTYPDHEITLNEATDITADKANISAIIAANKYGLQQIIFEYGLSPSIKDTKAANKNTISIGSADSIKATISGLQPGTKYSYRIKAVSNGKNIYSDIMQFTTMPEVSLSMSHVSSYPYTERNVGAYVQSYMEDITSVQFEYGLKGKFDLTIDANPNYVPKYQNTTASAVIKNNMLPDKTYNIRVKGVSNGKTHYSQPISFTTPPDYLFTISNVELAYNKAKITASLALYKYAVNSLELEYGKSEYLGQRANLTPEQANVLTFNIIKGEFHIEPQTLYYFRIKGKSPEGKSIYSPVFMVNTDKSILIGKGRPEEITDSTATIKFSLNCQGNQVYGAAIEYGNTNSYGSEKNILSGILYNPAELKTGLTNLEKNTTYYYRLKLFLPDGKFHYSDDFSFTTVDPAIVKKNRLIVYPNPVSGNSLSFFTESDFSLVQIIDLTGKIIFSSDLKTSEIDVSEIKSGIYILKVQTSTGVVTSFFTK